MELHYIIANANPMINYPNKYFIILKIKTVLRNYIYNIPNSLKLTDHNKPVFISELNDNFDNMDLPKVKLF